MSVPIVVQAPPPAGRRWNSAVSTPEPASAELEETAIVPTTKAPSAGAVSEPVGSVRSMVTLTTSAPVFPAPSVTMARRARLPSGSMGHEAEYGADASTPRETQVPLEQAVVASEQWKNSNLIDVAVRARRGGRERVGGAAVHVAGRRDDRDARGGVVHRDRARGRREGVPGLVGRDHAEFVVAVGEGGGVPAGGVGGARVGSDRRPGATACGPALELGVVDARAGVGGVGGDGGRVDHEGAVGRGGQRAGRARVVDEDVLDRRVERVAGAVDHAHEDADVAVGGLP